MDVNSQAALRRQKILRNAEARLKLITHGQKLEENNENSIKERNIVGDDSHKPPSAQCQSESTYENFISQSFVRNNDTLANDNVFALPRNNYNYEYMPLETIPVESEQQKIFDTACFLTLGLVTRLLFMFGFSWIFLENALLSFLLVCLPRLLLYPTSSSSTLSGIFSLLLLVGMPSATVRPFFYVLSTLRFLFKFFSLYMFSFLLTEFFIANIYPS